MNPANLHQCQFETDRLRVEPWHRSELPEGMRLADVVAQILTERSTRALPDEWHGDFTVVRAQAWIDERDAESPTLLATEGASGRPVGLVILYAVPRDDATVDLRIGYLFSEDSWGRGLATELVSGLVGWSRMQPSLHTLTGGVDATNEASARVLVKNGFSRISADADDEAVYQLDVLSGTN